MGTDRPALATSPSFLAAYGGIATSPDTPGQSLSRWTADVSGRATSPSLYRTTLTALGESPTGTIDGPQRIPVPPANVLREKGHSMQREEAAATPSRLRLEEGEPHGSDHPHEQPIGMLPPDYSQVRSVPASDEGVGNEEPTDHQTARQATEPFPSEATGTR
jgi:hypothetical protein